MSVDDTRSLVMSQMMTPDKANFSGKVHGGHILHMLDQVAYACAARYSGHYVVTLSVSNVTFRQPIYVGELVTCFASVNYVGNSSMEIGVRVEAENLSTKDRRHVLSCYFTMVAMDEDGNSCKVQPLTFDTVDQEKRYASAKLRREIHKEYLAKHAKISEDQAKL